MTISTDTSYKIIRKIKDDKFTIDKIEHYCLILMVGERDFQLSVIDTKTNRVLILEDYILNKSKDENQRVDILRSLFDHHHLLLVGFWKEVLLCFKTDKYALAPLSYFSKENARSILKMNCAIQTADSVGYYSLNSIDAVNIFTYSKHVLQFVRSVYVNSKIKVTHQSGMMVNAALNQPLQASENQLTLFIDRFYLHAAVSKDKKLLYYNSFHILKFEDYNKYINLICHEFQINKEKGSIGLWGFIKEKSAHFDALRKEFPALKIGVRTKELNFGFKFDEVPEHHYFDVYGNYYNL